MRSEARNKNQEIIAIGIGYAGQKVDSVPHDSFDQRIDWVVTEDEVCKF
jgi:5-formyltetrahydrofolate cyclo-ligase